jgi:hypothetical protein
LLGLQRASKTPSTYSPWRWQLKCLPTCWNTFNLQHGLHPKATVITIPEVPKLWGSWSFVGREQVVRIKDIFILTEIWAQGKIYSLVGIVLGWNILLTS